MSVNVRVAEARDLPAVLDLFESYSADGLRSMDTIMDKKRALDSTAKLIADKGAIVLEVNGNVVGGIAGYILPCLYSNDLIFSVMFFYIKDGHRKHAIPFLRRIEDILKSTAITRLIIANPAFGPNSDRMDRFYLTIGFRKLETHFVKAV